MNRCGNFDRCEDCGRLFFPHQHALVLIELEDQSGTWTEWVCEPCLDVIFIGFENEVSDVIRVAVYGFDLADVV